MIHSTPRPPGHDASDPQGIDRYSIHAAGLGMNIYVVDERRDSEIERGRSGEAILPASPDESPRIGEILLFARSQSRAGRRPRSFDRGDSVLASLAEDAVLGKTGHATGRALFRDRGKLLGLITSLDSPRHGGKAPRFPRLA